MFLESSKIYQNSSFVENVSKNDQNIAVFVERPKSIWVGTLEICV